MLVGSPEGGPGNVLEMLLVGTSCASAGLRPLEDQAFPAQIVF